MPRKPTGTVEFRQGRWWARITVAGPDGKKHRPWVDLERPDIPDTPKGRAEARRLAELHSKAVRGGTFQGKAPPSPASPLDTIATVAERWFALLDTDPSGMKPATIYDYRSRITAHVLPVLGPCPPPLTVPQLRSFLRDMKAKRSASTVRNTANALTRFLDDARGEGWIQGDNPMHNRDVRDLLPPMTSPDPEDIVRLELPQVRTLLGHDQLPDDRHGLYLIAVTSGMRDGELCGIQKRDVDIDATPPRVNVRQQLAMPRGKGGKAKLAPLKSRWSRRTLPLHPRAVEWLRPRLEGMADDALVLGDGTRRRAAEAFREDLQAAGLPTAFRGQDFTVHALRRTFASILEAAEVSGDLVDRMLGQAPASTRGRHYAAPSLDAMYRAVCQIMLDDPPDDPVGSPPSEPSEGTKRPAETSRKRVHESGPRLKTEANQDLAPVAQRIEQRFPKPLVGCSTQPGGATKNKGIPLQKGRCGSTCGRQAGVAWSEASMPLPRQ